MATVVTVLDIEKKEKLPLGETIHHTEDGTEFHWRLSSPQRLYVKKHGRDIDVKLPPEEIGVKGIHGNAIYFFSTKKIYKSVVTPANEIVIIHHRDRMEDEKDARLGGICTRYRNGKKYAYRVWDDPDRDGVVIDVKGEDFDSMGLLSLHRNRLLCITFNKQLEFPKVHKLKGIGHILEVLGPFSVLDSDSLSYFYFECKDTIYALDTKSMEIIFAAKINGIDHLHAIMYVQNGLINVKASIGNDKYWISVKHPSENSKNAPGSNFIKKYEIPAGVAIYQTEDGTVFHFKFPSPQRLYTEKLGREIDVKLPAEEIAVRGVHGNSIYFFSLEKIYKSIITSAGEIVIIYHRDRLEDETDKGVGAMCTRYRNGKKYAYRVWENPEKDGVVIDVNDEEFDKLSLISLHRNHPLYLTFNRELTDPRIQKLKGIGHILEAPSRISLYDSDSTPFLYIKCADSIFSVNTESMKILPSFKLDGIDSINSINGVHNGVILVTATMGDDKYAISVKLPTKRITQNVDSLSTLLSNSRAPRRDVESGKPALNLHARLQARETKECVQNIEALPERTPLVPRHVDFDGSVRMGRAAESGYSTAANSFSSSAEIPSKHRPMISEKLSQGPVLNKGQPNMSYNSSSMISFSTSGDRSSKQRSMVSERLTQGVTLNKRQSNSTTKEIQEFDSEFLKNFQSEGIIGMGSFGCVFKAHNLTDKCEYAVKRVPMRGSDKSVNDTFEEVYTLSSLRHEGIVEFNSSWVEKPPPGWQNRADASLLKSMGYNAGSFNHRDDFVFLYIQMELCNATLRDWLEENPERDLDLAKVLFKQIVSAVAYLHRMKKIHRDLKPSNILIAEDGRLKISDLGLVADQAIRNGQDVDRTRVVAGKYTAPEQRGERYSAKVDIFSLGLILTELCVCMSSDIMDEVFQCFQKGKPHTVLEHLPDVALFVSWLTNVDPSKRPDSQEIHDFLN